MKAQLIVLGFMALSLVGCKELKDIPGSYNIVTVDGMEMEGQGITINIEMTETGNSISGNNSCNEYSGSFTNPEGNQVEMGPMMGTKMYCVENAKTETAYMNALALVKKVELKNDVLQLMDEDGKVLIKAKKKDE
jgi:heat shock protein HslJ